jgi:hypothetical protein
MHSKDTKALDFINKIDKVPDNVSTTTNLVTVLPAIEIKLP